MFTKTEFKNLLNVNNYQINYYKEEGLLKSIITPDGKENFTDEDVINVGKFNFLLRINVSIGSIIRLKRGERELKDVIDNLRLELNTQLVYYTEIKHFYDLLYERLIVDNVTYENLDPTAYIPMIEELPYEVLNYFNRNPLEIQAQHHPIRRYFARSIDISFYSLLLTLIQYYVLKWYPKDTGLNNLLNVYLYMGLMLIIEPLLLSFIGTTPGKCLLGLIVRDASGNKLSLNASYKRTLTVFTKGFGYCIPFYNLYRNYRCYADSKNGHIMEWDVITWIENNKYIVKDKKGIRIIAYIVACIALILINIFISFQLYIPSNRGDLTPKEYIDNCNQIMERLHVDYAYKLNNDGKWVEKDWPQNTVILNPYQYPDFNLILTDGYVTGVRIDVSVNNKEVFYGIAADKQIAFLGFYGAQKNSNSIVLYSSKILSKIGEDYANYTYEIGNVRITNNVVMEGYTQSNYLLFPTGNEKTSLTMSFLIERVD
jgi:DNA-binding transcriptional MerR regulator/uncharacterized RDD family membrane protein YckC